MNISFSAELLLKQRTGGKVRAATRIGWNNLTPTRGLAIVTKTIEKRCDNTYAEIVVSKDGLAFKGSTRNVIIENSSHVAKSLFKAGISAIRFEQHHKAGSINGILNDLMDSRLGSLQKKGPAVKIIPLPHLSTTSGLCAMPSQDDEGRLNLVKATSTSAERLNQLARERLDDNYFRPKLLALIAAHPNCDEATHLVLISLSSGSDVNNELVWQAQARNPHLTLPTIFALIERAQRSFAFNVLIALAATTHYTAALTKLAELDKSNVSLLVAIGESSYADRMTVDNVLLSLEGACQKRIEYGGNRNDAETEFAVYTLNITAIHNRSAVLMAA